MSETFLSRRQAVAALSASAAVPLFAGFTPAFAQTSVPDAANQEASAAIQARIERARALVAAHQMSAATAELDSLRTTAKDDSIPNVDSLMLMSI